MARIRSIHPGLFTDEAYMLLTVECPLACALLPGIWTEADDQGVLPWKPISLKARLLPAVECDISTLLGALLKHGFMKRFEVDGKQYLALKNFRAFQRPERPKPVHPLPDELRAYVGLEHKAHPGADKNPPPFGDPETGEGEPPQAADRSAAQMAASPELSVSDHQTIDEQSPIEQRNLGQMERRGEESRRDLPSVDLPRASARETQVRSLDAFEAWWREYPRKVGKDAARKAYASARKRGASDGDLLLGIRNQRWRPDPQFNPHPATWLNQGRWQDDPSAAAPPDQTRGDKAWDALKRWEDAEKSLFSGGMIQ